MKSSRPVFLDLARIRFPISAIASILHRIAGGLVFIGLCYLLYLLGLSTSSAEEFAEVKAMLTEPLHSTVLWAILSALGYHLIAGLRHILMDLHFCDSLIAGRNTAAASILLGVVLSTLIGAWLWL